MRRRAVVLALGLALGLLADIHARAADLERDLKVAYLYNFTRFIDWPALAPGVPFVIAVGADPTLARALRALERSGKQVQGRPIRVRELTDADAIDDVQVLFIGAAARAELPRLAARTAGRPVLLVGDSEGLARRGVAIDFYLQRDILGSGRRLRFEINPAALQGRGLKVQSQLYDVARIIK